MLVLCENFSDTAATRDDTNPNRETWP